MCCVPKNRAQSDSLARGQRAWPRARLSLRRRSGGRSSSSASRPRTPEPKRGRRPAGTVLAVRRRRKSRARHKVSPSGTQPGCRSAWQSKGSKNKASERGAATKTQPCPRAVGRTPLCASRASPPRRSEFVLTRQGWSYPLTSCVSLNCSTL